MYKTILVALDYGPCMSLVSQEAIGYATAFDAKLILCHVKKKTAIYHAVADPLGMVATPHMIQENTYSIDEVLEQVKEQALAAGVASVEIVQSQSTAPGITISDTIAIEHNVDLIVTGRNDKSQLNRLLLGSVSSNIINYATCDVLLVKNNREN